ncbi:unnamed protein product [Linum tenue]|uniref:Uncharacterized protein n=1 Tax=Linum tenue TaxID=586396 RepID=A0AAV0KRY2_9ROSI|nr:unnamed protein product [Linum tenue]
MMQEFLLKQFPTHLTTFPCHREVLKIIARGRMPMECKEDKNEKHIIIVQAKLERWMHDEM